jgi:hypothetical protein
MTTDELLDAHMQRLRDDPGYAAIWRRARALPNMQLITAMLAWAEQADGLRAMCATYGQIVDGRQFLVECPHCKAWIGVAINT